jgi:hypothetical protein
MFLMPVQVLYTRPLTALGMSLSSPCSTNIGLQLKSNPGEYWSARDIMFVKEKPDPLNQPYVVWDFAGEPSTDQNQESSALIRSEVLFPLGLILIQPSLCRNLSSSFEKPEPWLLHTSFICESAAECTFLLPSQDILRLIVPFDISYYRVPARFPKGSYLRRHSGWPQTGGQMPSPHENPLWPQTKQSSGESCLGDLKMFGWHHVPAETVSTTKVTAFDISARSWPIMCAQELLSIFFASILHIGTASCMIS